MAIEEDRNVFIKMQKLLKCQKLRLDLRLRMVLDYVFPTVLYGMKG